MKKEGYSCPGLFGTMKHYDANGNKIGESTPGFFGGMNNYDAMLIRVKKWIRFSKSALLRINLGRCILQEWIMSY